MLGRSSYTADEIAAARKAVKDQLAAFVSANSTDPEFENVYFNNMVLALDRYFVHRVRAVSGKDGNPLNEVELISDSLMANNAILRGNKVITYRPEVSVLNIEIGSEIRVTQADFEQLSTAFLEQIDTRFGE